ncbi:MAG: hypothetical protein PHV42_04285 [Candidatus Pacebacteria bacterium]|nr:hypothetical protein [Candidatus Paceibacterota bacterium]
MRDQLTIFTHNNFGMYDRDIGKVVGHNASVILTELIEEREYYSKKLVNSRRYGDGWFYATIDHIQERCQLGRKEQDHALRILKKHGLVEIQVFGQPPKRHFRINIEKVLEIKGLKIINTDMYEKDKVSVKSNTKSRVSLCPKDTDCAVQKGQNASLYTIRTQDKNHKNSHIALSCDKGDPCKNCEKKAASAACVCDPPSSKYRKPKEQIPDTKKSIESKPYELAVKAPEEDKIAYGEEQIVMMTPKQHEKLLALMPKEEVDHWIKKLQNWMLQIGETNAKKKYKDHYRTILNWRDKDLDKHKDSQGRDMSKIAPHRRGSKLVTPGDYDDDNFKRPRL